MGGGLIPGLAAFSSVVRGQQQGQEATAAYQQQLQARQLNDQITRALNLGKLQDYSDQREALNKVSPEEKQFLQLGGTPDMWQKRQERTTRAGAIADQLYTRSLDQNLSVEERIQAAQLSSRLRTSPELADNLPEQLKIGGIGDKTGRPFAFVDKDTGAPIMYSGTGPVPPNAVPEGVYASLHKTATDKMTSHFGVESDDKGNPITVQYRVDAAGNVVSKSTVGRGKLSEVATRQLMSVSSAQDLAQGIRDDYAAIEPKYKAGGAPWLLNQWRLYSPTTNPGGWFGKPDPDAERWFSHVGQIKTDLLQAAAGNSRNLTMVNNLFGPHVPSEWQSPDSVIARVEAFEKDGRFDSIKNSLGVGAPAGGANPAAGAAKQPVYDAGGKLIGYTTDGKTMEPVR